ncbi:MAG: PAS domain-containing protein [Candidatus Methanomethylophilaceae archaeon]|nr:PAS domain-containing protein [Candidatus Methanomethylophilaceae archaeon]
MAELSQFFKSIIDQDTQAVVVCNLMHEIIYMNPAAVEEYSDRGGEKLIGLLIFDCHSKASAEKIEMVVKWFSASKENNIVHTFFNESRNMDFYMVALRDEDGRLIGYYEKHESRTRDVSRPYGMSGH